MALLKTTLELGFSSATPFADVVILISGRRLYAHQAIVSEASDYFARALQGGMKESKSQIDENGKELKTVEFPDRTQEEAEDFMLWMRMIYSSETSSIWNGPGEYLHLKCLSLKPDKCWTIDFAKTYSWCGEILGESVAKRTASNAMMMLKFLDKSVIRLQKLLLLSEYLQAAKVQNQMFCLYSAAICLPEHLIWAMQFQSSIASGELFDECCRRIQIWFPSEDDRIMESFNKIFICLLTPTTVMSNPPRHWRSFFRLTDMWFMRMQNHFKTEKKNYENPFTLHELLLRKYRIEERVLAAQTDDDTDDCIIEFKDGQYIVPDVPPPATVKHSKKKRLQPNSKEDASMSKFPKLTE